MLARIIALLAVLMAASSPSFGALPGMNGYQGGAVEDVRAFGAKCANNSSDFDEAAFTAGYLSLSGRGGGTLVVPAGATCYVNTDVFVEDNVKLKCEPGGTIKATAAGSFTLGLLRWLSSGFANQNNASIEGCTFDLNGRALTAIQASGNDIAFDGITVENGATSNGSNWSMAQIACNGGTCRVANSVFTCGSATAGAKDIGLSVSAGSATLATTIANSTITNCDIAGISISTQALLTGNAISSATASAIGISSTGDYVKIAGNTITMTGTTSTGVVLDDSNVLEGNNILMSASTGGTEAQIGVKVNGIGTRIYGNQIQAAVDESNTGISVANQHARIVGNYILNGKYGVAPSEVSAAERAAGINAYVDSNEIWGIDGTGIIAITGWMAANNYISWGAASSISVVIGDVRGNEKLGNSHTTINNNRLHSAAASSKGVVFALGSAKICDANSTTRPYRSCTTDDTNGTTGCPGSTCPGTIYECCVDSTDANIVISGNEFLFQAGSVGPLVDLAAGIDANSQTIDNVLISGNSVSLDSADTYIAFPSSNQTKVTNIRVMDPPLKQGVYVSNFTAAQGVLGSYPQIVADLPAAGCVGSVGSSFWDLPTTNPAVPACAGSTYARGVLNFTDGGGAGSALSAYTSLVLPYPWLGTLYADVWWGNNNTTACNVVWQITGVCVADDDGEDPAFSSTANSVTAAVDTTHALDVDKQTITLSNAANNPLNTCAAGETMHLRFFRDPANASDSCTTSIASLYRVVLRQW